MVCRRYENMVGEGVQVLCGGPHGKSNVLELTVNTCDTCDMLLLLVVVVVD